MASDSLHGPLQTLFGELIYVLDAAEQAKMLGVASFMLMCYEYLITLDQEIEFFWSGEWTPSRVLFFMSRYITPCIEAVVMVTLFAEDLSPEFCEKTIPALFLLDIAALAIVQAPIVLRIWYLYLHKTVGRIIVVGTYAIITIACFGVLGSIWHELRPLPIPPLPPIAGWAWRGCFVPDSHHVWKLFVPTMIMHTVLFVATTWPAIRMRQLGQSSPVIDRLIRDGGVFYIVVFAAASFTCIGSFQSRLDVALSAIFSNFMLVITSISVCRLMLSLHSLAAGLSLDPKWLLNNAELSRVRWRRGSHEGELIVEIDVVEEPDRLELGQLSPHFDVKANYDSPAILTTRVGMLAEPLPYHFGVGRL